MITFEHELVGNRVVILKDNFSISSGHTSRGERGVIFRVNLVGNKVTDIGVITDGETSHKWFKLEDCDLI